MKNGYKKPAIEIEEYTLDTAIASGCMSVVNLGPGDDRYGYKVCSDYEVDLGISAYAWNPGDKMDPTVTNFYPESCSCYLSAGTGTMFTS